MTFKHHLKGFAARTLRQKEFADALQALTREELFKKRRADMADQIGSPKMSVDEIDDMLSKDFATEAEILQRYGAAGLSEYKVWHVANEPEAG